MKGDAWASGLNMQVSSFISNKFFVGAKRRKALSALRQRVEAQHWSPLLFEETYNPYNSLIINVGKEMDNIKWREAPRANQNDNENEV